MNQQDFLNTVQDYKNVIKAWKKRADVQSGYDLAWKPKKDSEVKLENKPYGFGDGTGTTGWCVSASQSLLNDKYFQELMKIKMSKAKLISIDIKEQYYGYCYNGSQNKWHTAILVEDSGFYFVIDVTCRQFGNNFIGKDIWDFSTWQDTLRSPKCKHNLVDFYDNEISYIPKLNDLKVFNKDYLYSDIFYNLQNQTNLNNNDRNTLTDFLVNQILPINNKILTHSLSVSDYNYLTEINKLLNLLNFESYNKTYSILEFNSKDSAKNWLNGFLNNQCKIDMYLITYPSIENACKIQDIDYNDINSKKQSGKFYVIIEFNNQFGISLKEYYKQTDLLIPFNIALEVKNVINGILKFDYDNLIKLGENEENINNKIFELSENLIETDKLNTSWVIVNNM